MTRKPTPEQQRRGFSKTYGCRKGRVRPADMTRDPAMRTLPALFVAAPIVVQARVAHVGARTRTRSVWLLQPWVGRQTGRVSGVVQAIDVDRTGRLTAVPGLGNFAVVRELAKMRDLTGLCARMRSLAGAPVVALTNAGRGQDRPFPAALCPNDYLAAPPGYPPCMSFDAMEGRANHSLR